MLYVDYVHVGIVDRNPIILRNLSYSLMTPLPLLITHTIINRYMLFIAIYKSRSLTIAICISIECIVTVTQYCLLIS
jgi:hypothetical protein